MRIDRLYIDGFGHFYQTDITTSAPLTVISGANEAGKSTILEFVRTVLFGFPARLADRFYPPMAGGAHGGRLTLTTRAGQQYTVQRYQGRRGGPLDITGPDGAHFDEAMMPSLVGPSADLFKSVFAFSLDELQDMKSLRGEEVSGRIYSAGVGAANLPGAVREIDASRQAIFAPRGRTHKVANILNELQEAETRLAELADQASEYGRHTARGEEVREELESIAARRAELSSQERDLERLSRALEEWTPIRLREDRLKELPQFERFPEDAVVRLEGLDERIEETEPEVGEAQAALALAESEAAKDVPDEDLVPEAMEIESIRRGRDSFDGSVHDLPERRAKLGEFDEKLTRDLRDLGHGWDEPRLEEFDASMVVRDDAEQWRQRLTVASQAIRDRTGGLDRARQVEQDAVQARHEAEEALQAIEPPALDSGQPQEQRRHLRTARSGLINLLGARQRLQDLEDQLQGVSGAASPERAGVSRIPLLPVLLVVGGLVAAVLGIALEGQQTALALGVVLVVAGVVAYVRGRSGRPDGLAHQKELLRSQIHEAEAREQSAEAELKSAGERLGTSDVDSQALDDLEEALVMVQEAIRRHHEATDALAKAERLLARQETRTGEAHSLLDDATAANESALGAWHDWLTARGLADTLTPNTFIDLLGRVKAARVQRTQVVQMRDRIKAMERDVSQYRALVGPVAGRHGASLNNADVGKVAMVADDLISRLDQARAAVLAKENAEKNAEGARRHLESVERRLARLKADRQQLMVAGGATDAEDLRRRAGLHQQSRDLERQLTEEREHLQRLCLPDQPLQELIDLLAHTSPESLEDELATVRQELDALDARRSDLDEERGTLASELGQMATDEASSELRAHRESLFELLKVQAAEWSKLAIASTILQRTRQKYEQERQPGVIRHAQEFFATITGGRYARVFVPADMPSEVFVEQTTGAILKPDQLSRGTREQLYLALRFGLIREFGERAESLPVIVDEVLVNFDPDRAQRAAEAFAELSLTNQVLVFTCHPSTVEAFTSAQPGAQVIELPSG